MCQRPGVGLQTICTLRKQKCQKSYCRELENCILLWWRAWWVLCVQKMIVSFCLCIYMATENTFCDSQCPSIHWWEQGCDFSHFLSQRTVVYVCWWKTSAGRCLRASSGRSSRPWASVSRASCSSAIRTLRAIDLPIPHFVVSVARGPEGAIPFWTLRPTSLCRDLYGPKGPAIMQALPALRPHAAQLQVHASVCGLWWASPFRGVLYSKEAA